MENQRDDLVVILCRSTRTGWTPLPVQPGHGSRIAHHLDFPDYSEPELLRIAELMLDGLPPLQRRRARPSGSFRRCASRSRTSPTRAACGNALDRARWMPGFAPVRRPRARELDEAALTTLDEGDIRASRGSRRRRRPEKRRHAAESACIGEDCGSP